MAFISYENSTNQAMKEGDYECVLRVCEIGATRAGTECIICDFMVRNDVEQENQNRHVFKRFYRDEEGRWPAEKIGKMANALGVEKGSSFELVDLVGLCCILHVKPYTPPDGGDTRDSIFYFAPTKVGQMLVPGSRDHELLDVTEDVNDELPF